MAVRTLARHVTVGQKLLRLLVVELRRGFLRQFALFVEFFEEIRGKLVVGFARRATVDVERDAEIRKTLFDEFVVAIDHILRRDALFSGTNRDGNAVFIASANVHHILFFQSQIAHINVGRHVNAREVSDVYAAVCVGQCRRHGRPLITSFFHISFAFLIFRVQRYE